MSSCNKQNICIVSDILVQVVHILVLVLGKSAQHVSGILMPIIRSSTTAVAASGLPLERGGSSVVGRGRSG